MRHGCFFLGSRWTTSPSSLGGQRVSVRSTANRGLNMERRTFISWFAIICTFICHFRFEPSVITYCDRLTNSSDSSIQIQKAINYKTKTISFLTGTEFIYWTRSHFFILAVFTASRDDWALRRTLASTSISSDWKWAHIGEIYSAKASMRSLSRLLTLSFSHTHTRGHGQ